jgi:ketosteroid isomerase-like protein
MEANKGVAIGLYDALERGDLDALDPLMDDRMTWWVQGFPTMGKIEFIDLSRRFLALYRDGIRFTYRSVTAEGNRVALELEGYAELKDGRIYNNHYFMCFEVVDGRIVAVREYHDSKHAMEIWG